MKLLQAAVKKLEENCPCDGSGPGMGGIRPGALMSFMIQRNRAEEEEVDPVGPSPEGEDGVEAQLKSFFSQNPNPQDDDVHALADKLGMDPHAFEERIYKLLSSLLSKEEPVQEGMEIPDSIKNATSNFHTNIETDTIKNKNFRKVLFTTEKTQLVLMSLKPGEDIGMESHDGDQFFRFEKGEGKIIMGGKTTRVSDGASATVRQGTRHNVVNTSKTDDLKLYAIYSPPQHKDGTVNPTKPKGGEEH